MRFGNWVPMDKRLAVCRPVGRPYSRLEAAFSLQLDYDNDRTVTIAGYADLWSWSRGKVTRFLKDIGVEIHYPESTKAKQRQRGQIVIQKSSRSRAENGQIRFIDSKDLRDNTNRKRTEDEQKTDRSQSTTRYPNPNPNPNSPHTPPQGGVNYSSSFVEWWTIYPKKVGQDAAARAWQKAIKHSTPNELITALRQQNDACHFKGDNGKDYIPNPSTWLNQGRWKDEIKQQSGNDEEYIV